MSASITLARSLLAIADKADISYVDTQLALKANATDVANSLATKADDTATTNALATKVDSSSYVIASGITAASWRSALGMGDAYGLNQGSVASSNGGLVTGGQVYSAILSLAPAQDLSGYYTKTEVDAKLAGTVTISTSQPSGGSDGDIWFVVT